MAQQYSSAPSYGAQYPAAPYYSPFNPSAGQQMNSGTPTLQQSNAHHSNPQTPASLTNTARYDTNAHLSSQPAPLPFAPQFNPDFLKQFPPPPPPPPPNAHFGLVPGGVPGFLQFPQQVNSPIPQIPQQGYPPFGQPPVPVNNGAGSAQNLPFSHDPRPHKETVQTHDTPPLPSQFHAQPSSIQPGELSVLKESPAQPFDGNSGVFESIPGLAQRSVKGSDDSDSMNGVSNPTEIHGGVVLPLIGHSLVEPQTSTQTDTQPMTLKVATPSELKERAKVALLSLVPHNVRYHDFIEEGVSPLILQQLYNELGLNWKSHEDRSGKTAPTSASRSVQKLEATRSQDQATASLLIPSASATSDTVVKPTPTAASRASPVISPNLERKDRIAQLLAAKAGKAASSGIGSKSQSPVCASGLTQSQRADSGTVDTSRGVPTFQPVQAQVKTGRSIAQTEIVKQKMEQLRRETLTKTRGDRAGEAQKSLAGTAVSDEERNIAAIASQVQQTKSLPTPIREHLVQNGFGSIIPGLFMTSGELDDDGASSHTTQIPNIGSEAVADLAVRDSANLSPAENNTIILKSPSSSHKRSFMGDSLDEREYPEAKRRAVEDGETFDMSMDVEEEAQSDASEGEIIDDEVDGGRSEQFLSEGTAAFPANTEAANQHFLNKQVEIDTMRKRIAEMEQRQTLKRGTSYVLSPTESLNTTPNTHLAPQTTVSSPLTKDLEGMLTKSDERGIQSPRSLVKATPEQIAERAAQLKADFLRQRALRKQLLTEGLPALDDEVAKTQSKLKDTRLELLQVRKELEQHEANLVRARQTEEKLVHDIENLQKQITQGITGQKQFSNELTKLNQSSKDEHTQPLLMQNTFEEQPPDPEGTTQQNPLELSQGLNAIPMTGEPFTEINPVPADSQQLLTHEQSSRLEGEARPMTEASLVTAVSSRSHIADDNPKAANTTSQTTIEPTLSVPQELKPTVEAAIEQADEPMDVSDEPMDESDEESDDDSHMSIDEESNDSASMSDSGSDDYEPAEPELSLKFNEKAESDGYEPEADGSQSNDADAEDEGDDYEPAEDYELTEDIVSVDTPGTSTTPVLVSNVSTAVALSGAHGPIGVVAHTSADTTQISQAHQGPWPDDREAGLQLSEADTLIKSQEILKDEEEDESNVLGATEPSTAHYAPYQSPLSSFKSYRFHPLFRENVKDGYRSLTYSHKIDPKLPLCPSELDGVICTDPQCQEQHFSSMALKDDKILVQMSTANEIKEKPLRDMYLIGLKQVIAGLRQEGVKEFSDVAYALSEYRRQWNEAQNGI